MGTETILALVGGLSALGSAAVAIVAIYDNRKNEREHLIYNRGEKIEKWYKETLQILKELYYLPTSITSPLLKKERSLLIAKLSTQIDIGRGYFKNLPKGVNENKPELFKGKRVLPLELLVMYHHIFEKGYDYLEKDGTVVYDNKPILRNIERAFISEVTLYNQVLLKNKKDVPYTISDDTKLLLSDHVLDAKYKTLFENNDLVELVKQENERAKQQSDKHEEPKVEELASKQKSCPLLEEIEQRQKAKNAKPLVEPTPHKTLQEEDEGLQLIKK